jgi:hypothetical protein
MENIENFEEDGVALGLGAAEIRSVARRQLVGSTVAAVLIVVVATLTALRPAYRETADIAAQVGGDPTTVICDAARSACRRPYAARHRAAVGARDWLRVSRRRPRASPPDVCSALAQPQQAPLRGNRQFHRHCHVREFYLSIARHARRPHRGKSTI